MELLAARTASCGPGPLHLYAVEVITQEYGQLFHVVEVGFCTEVAYAQKYKAKYEQHRTLLESLKNAGYADVRLHLLIFGSTGGMFKLTALHLERLGVFHSNVESVLQDMHWKALRRLEQIVGTRRRLEHDSNQGIQCGPLANKRKHGT